MATATRDQRRRWWGLRICVVCAHEYLPSWPKQVTCGHVCKVKRDWRQRGGQMTPKQKAARRRGGLRAAQTRRRQAIATLAAQFGEVVTDRDLAMFRLGWRHCQQTNHGSWLKDRGRQRGRLAMRAPAMLIPERRDEAVA